MFDALFLAAFNALQCLGMRLLMGGKLAAWQLGSLAAAGAVYSLLWDAGHKVTGFVFLMLVNFLCADDDLPRRMRKRAKRAANTLTKLQEAAFRREAQAA